MKTMLLLALLLPQEAASRPREPGPDALFARAVQTQTPGGEPFEIRDFKARLEVVNVEHDDSGSSRTNQGRVEWRWLRTPKGRSCYFRHLVRPDGQEVWLCHDGRRALMKEGSQGAVRLSAAQYRKDREQLEEERQRTDELVDMMLLVNLRGPGTVLASGERGVTLPVRRGAARVVTDEVRVERPAERSLTLRIGRNDHRLYGVVLEPEAPGAPTEEVRFDYHEERLPLNEGERFRKLLVPLRMVFLEDGRPVLEAHTNDAGAIVFNSGLSARRDFRLPRPR